MLDRIQTFSELMQHVQRGDADALQTLLDEYGESIRREVRFTLLDARLRRVVGDSDVYQSVVLRFFSGVRNGDFEIESAEDLIGLLKGIARTRIAELVRYWHAQKRNLSRNVSLTENQSQQVLENGSRPEDVLARTDSAEAASQLVPPRDLQILAWRDEHLSWSEIAARLGAASGEAVRKQHERSLARVADQLDDDRPPASRKSK